MLQFDLVSPERAMASGQASQVTAPGMEGDLTALPGHAPFLTALRPGVVSAVMGSETKRFVVFGGFVEIAPERVSVLADDVFAAGEVSAEVIDARITEAEAALKAAGGGDEFIAAQRLEDLRTLKSLNLAA
ncbi:MAG: ATP synthase F1 subunit epsilon [Pseudomonadota bacterium]